MWKRPNVGRILVTGPQVEMGNMWNEIVLITIPVGKHVQIFVLTCTN